LFVASASLSRAFGGGSFDLISAPLLTTLASSGTEALLTLATSSFSVSFSDDAEFDGVSSLDFARFLAFSAFSPETQEVGEIQKEQLEQHKTN
jgi:hypothetical protein